ncbi:hypothetical protein ACFWZK_20680 [[Kitasatospora] papulosa]|uniref:hypothetical protein n=1 Tax=Streptomyces TaxID=1883 RepID=UPI0033C26160
MAELFLACRVVISERQPRAVHVTRVVRVHPRLDGLPDVVVLVPERPHSTDVVLHLQQIERRAALLPRHVIVQFQTDRPVRPMLRTTQQLH